VPQELQNRVTGFSHARLAPLQELVATDPRLIFSVSTDAELAIEACAHTGMREIIRFHLDHGAPLSLPTAVSLGDDAAVDFWLARDPTLVNERGAHDFPLMWYAVLGGGSVAMAERLARHGVPLDQETQATTALHLCAKRDDPDLAAWLLERGLDANAVGYAWSRAGKTPLQIALAEGHERVAGLLKGAGARR
jgi:ankyrin repeat protein